MNSEVTKVEYPNANDFNSCVRALEEGSSLSREQWKILLEGKTEERQKILAKKASWLRDQIYGNRVFIRGLIEFTNYCRNDCYYCGIQRSNRKVERYRLTKEEILSCCRSGFAVGFRTFVLQGGEDSYFTAERLAEIVRAVKEEFPEAAITLSAGEMEKEDYRILREAGADRYLLRHETANPEHYQYLHPPQLSLSHRLGCLRSLKELGFQTGAGFMVGSPGQTTETLIDDLMFLSRFQPEMVGIGPFIPHRDTPFREEPAGDFALTLYLLSLVRLLLPNVLLPATTALGTISPRGREAGILAGANVVMPNLSPRQVRGKYQLYDNKLCTGKEAAECLEALKKSIASVGCSVVVDRGDFKIPIQQ